jgi:hypothetical protein
LKCPIVEEAVRLPVLEAELPEELKFLLGKIATKHWVLDELGEPGPIFA